MKNRAQRGEKKLTTDDKRENGKEDSGDGRRKILRQVKRRQVRRKKLR